MKALRQAFESLFSPPNVDDGWARRGARIVLEVTLVLLGFVTLSSVVASMTFEASLARTVAAILVGSVYAALYLGVAVRHSRVPAAWSSVGLVVLELTMLSILLPFLVGLVHFVVPQYLLSLFLGATNETAWGTLIFLAFVLFAIKGWGRYVSRSAQVLAAKESSKGYERLALEDTLTGLPNRRKFEESATAWLCDASTSKAGLSLLMIDVNKFKFINDNFSHNVGDEVLKGIARILRANVRKRDLAARLAGDEFVVVLRDADMEFADRMSQRLTKAVLQCDWTEIAPNLPVSISVGFATTIGDESLASLMHRSDAQMYAVKRSNSPVCADFAAVSADGANAAA